MQLQSHTGQTDRSLDWNIELSFVELSFNHDSIHDPKTGAGAAELEMILLINRNFIN